MNASLGYWIDMRLSPTFQEHPPAHFAFRIPRYRWFPAYGECFFFMLAGTSKSKLGTDIVCELLIESRGLNLTVWDIRKGEIYNGIPSCDIIKGKSIVYACLYNGFILWKLTNRCFFVGENFHFSYIPGRQKSFRASSAIIIAIVHVWGVATETINNYNNC